MSSEKGMPIRIGVVVGSDSDLKGQCGKGFRFLREQEEAGKVKVVEVVTASIHRNTEEALEIIAGFTSIHPVDVLIVGAGLANHLTGTVDAYLRYELRNDQIPVIGVAFVNNEKDPAGRVALDSTAHVPGTQAIFRDVAYGKSPFIGSSGFLLACKYAAAGNFPILTLPDSKPVQRRTLDAAIAFIETENQPTK